MSFRLRDLPPAFVACVPAADRASLGLSVPEGVSGGCPEQRPLKRAAVGFRGPNATELAYLREGLVGVDARYEALTFRLANGHRYTPDWVVFFAGAPVACHEVKGAYRLHSHGRARLAFDQARVEFPGLAWVWGVVRRGHIADCEVYWEGVKQ